MTCFVALGATALLPHHLPRLHPSRRARVQRPVLCSGSRDDGEAPPGRRAPNAEPPQTSWAEELTACEPDEAAGEAFNRAGRDRMTVVDIEGDVGGFIEQFASLMQSATAAAELEGAEEEDPPGSQRDVIERVLDERLLVLPQTGDSTPSSRRRLAELDKRAEEEAEELAAAGSPFLGPLSFVGSWPIGDPRANPEVGGQRGLRSVQW